MTTQKHNPIQLIYSISICLFAVFLTACISTNSTLKTVTSTKMVEPTEWRPESSIVPTGTSTSTLTAVITPSPTLAQVQVTATSTVTNTPEPLPTLPEIKSASSYTLGTPSPIDLMEQVALASKLNELSAAQYSFENVNPEIEALGNDVEGLRHTLDQEFDLYYSGHLPDPSLVLQYYPLKGNNGLFYPHIYLDLLSDSVFEDITKGSISLSNSNPIKTEHYEVEAYSIELDHDPSPEWLVKILWKDIVSFTWLVLDQNADGSYRRLQAGLPNISFDSSLDNTIDLIKDFTGDGITDVLYQDYTYVWGTEQRIFYVIKGSPDGFQQIGKVSQSVRVDASDGDEYEIKVPPEVPGITIIFRDPNSISWGCNWDTIETYRWPNGIQQKTVEGTKPPQTPHCQLAQAVRVDDPPDIATSIQLLESVVRSMPANDPFRLFAHYRLSVLYALSGSDALSRQHFEWFVNHYQKSKTLLDQKLKPMLLMEQINPIELCNLFLPQTTEAYETIPEGWRDYISVGRALNAYPFSSEPYPPAICPIESVLIGKMTSVLFDPYQSPEAALKEAGVPVASAHPYVFDHQKPPAWFVLLNNLYSPYVVGYIPEQEDGSKWKIIKRFDHVISFPEVFSKDTTGDGFLELVFYAKPRESWGCKERELGRVILMITSFGSGSTSVSDIFCYPSREEFEVKNVLLEAV